MFRPSRILFQMAYCGHVEERGRVRRERRKKRRKTKFESRNKSKENSEGG